MHRKRSHAHAQYRSDVQGVDPRRLTDPGPQLKKVLEFKERLEAERWLLFSTFDTIEEFENDLLGHLLRWVRDAEKGTQGTAPTPPPSEPPQGAHATDIAGDDASDLLDRAKQLAKEGKLTRAESIYARAVLAGPDVESLTQYTRFLRRAGRLDMAATMSERLLEVGRAQGDLPAQIEALSNQGIINRKRGDYVASKRELEEAMALARAMGDAGESNIAFLLDNLALTFRKEGRFESALEYSEQALEIRRRGEDQRGLANSLNNVGALRRQRGDVDAAVEMHEQAISLFAELEDRRGEAQAHANLGEALHAAGRLDDAHAEYERSLELNQALNSPEGIGMNCWQLGRLALTNGDSNSASSYATRCLLSDEGADRPESIGGALHLIGQVDLAAGNADEAIPTLERALSIYRGSGQRLGEAWTAADLAKAQAVATRLPSATEALQRATALGANLEHVQFQAALDEARGVVRAAFDAQGLEMPTRTIVTK